MQKSSDRSLTVTLKVCTLRASKRSLPKHLPQFLLIFPAFKPPFGLWISMDFPACHVYQRVIPPRNATFFPVAIPSLLQENPQKLCFDPRNGVFFCGKLVGFYQKWLPEIPIAMTLTHAHKGRFGDEVLRDWRSFKCGRDFK